MERRKRSDVLMSRLGLIGIGVSLGFLARSVLGPPEDDSRLPRRIERPISESLELDGDTEQVLLPIELPLDGGKE